MKEKLQKILILVKKELKDYFSTPVAYIVLGVFSLVSGIFFSRNLFLENEASLRTLFDFIPLIWIVIIPAMTMSSFANERKSGTLEILTTLPVSRNQIVLSKILANVSMATIMIFLTIPAAVTVSVIGNPDFGQMIVGYFGLWAVAFTYVVLGVLVSIRSKNQISAYIFSVLIIGVLYILGEEFVMEQIPLTYRNYFEYFGIGYHYDSVIKGVIDTRDLLYFLAINVIGIMLISSSYRKLIKQGK